MQPTQTENKKRAREQVSTSTKPTSNVAAIGHVTLFTDRPLFAQEWTRALGAVGLDASATNPERLPEALQRGEAIVIDAGSDPYDEDELLAHVGLARALGACAVVSLPVHSAEGSSIGDLLDDLCGGLVTRRAEDITRVVATLARRADPGRSGRFEYLTVSPRGGELLAIFSDGTAVLVDREVLDGDDGTEVEAIALEDDATRAVLSFESGEQLELTPITISRKGLLGSGGRGINNGTVDGVRLGARIRELRLAANLTQAELAKRTGIHRPNIARVEAGRHTPSLETLARLASAIGVPTTRVLDD